MNFSNFLKKRLFYRAPPVAASGGGGVKRGWMGPRGFDVVFSFSGGGLVSGSGAGRWALPPAGFKIFLSFPSFLRSRS